MHITCFKIKKYVPSCRDITFASGSILSIIALDIACNEQNSTSLGQKPARSRPAQDYLCKVHRSQRFCAFYAYNVNYAYYTIYVNYT